MRAFFGLPVEGKPRNEVRRWRDGNLLGDGRRVPEENFHITLCFLGSVAPEQLSVICDQVDDLRGSAFELVLDQPGYFPRPRVVWIGPTQIPQALSELSCRLGRIASRSGLRIDKRPYQPHLTLIRKCRDPSLPPLDSPRIALTCDHFCLFESRSTDQGVRYLPLASWPLSA
jgi:2'-5' RNA ligase